MGPSIWQLVIVLVIVLLLFGAKRLRNVGTDLGSAIKGFRSSMKDGEKEGTKSPSERIAEDKQGHVIDGEVTQKSTQVDKDKV